MKVTIFCLIFLRIEAEFDDNTLDVTRAVAIFAKNRERTLIERRQEMKFNSKQVFVLWYNKFLIFDFPRLGSVDCPCQCLGVTLRDLLDVLYF